MVIINKKLIYQKCYSFFFTFNKLLFFLNAFIFLIFWLFQRYSHVVSSIRRRFFCLELGEKMLKQCDKSLMVYLLNTF